MYNTNKRFVKLTTKDCIHNGYEYKEGLNVLNGEFNTKSICAEGGLYFCEIIHIFRWLSYNGKEMYYIWDVILPDDALIVKMRLTSKTNKFILKNKRYIWEDQECCKLIVQNDGMKLKNMINPSEDIYKLAIKQNGLAINYIPENIIKSNIGEKLCELAVKQNFNALKFIIPEKQSFNICKIALQNDGHTLQYISEQVFEMCKIAVSTNGLALKFVNKKYLYGIHGEELCRIAIIQNCWALEFVPKEIQTFELCKLAVMSQGWTIKFVHNKTVDICKLAIMQNSNSLKYVIMKHHPFEFEFELKIEDKIEIFKFTLQMDGMALKYINDEEQTSDLCKIAVIQNGIALQYVPLELINEEICKLSVEQNGFAIEFIPKKYKTYQLCKLAVKQNGLAIKYIPDNYKTEEICKLAVSKYSWISDIYKNDKNFIKKIKL